MENSPSMLDQVTNLELSRELKALGAPQDQSFHFWGESNDPAMAGRLFLFDVSMGTPEPEWTAAFTAGELGHLLPQMASSCRWNDGRWTAWWHIGHFRLDGASEAEARGKLYAAILARDLARRQDGSDHDSHAPAEEGAESARTNP